MTYNHLSPAERKVLTLIALGREDKEIALELGMSPWTVKTHLQNLRDKLGAVNRTHAVALGISRGLIHLPRFTPAHYD